MPRLRLATVIAIFVSLLPLTVSAVEDPTDRSWMDGFTLVQLDTDDIGSLHRARAFIQSRGGTIAIMSEPGILMGWVDPKLRGELIGQYGIHDIYYTEVLPGEIATNDRRTDRMVRYFNGVVTGKYNDLIREQAAAQRPAENEWLRAPDHDGRRVTEPFEKDAYEQNLRSNGFDIQQLSDRGVLIENATSSLSGNSDKMGGTVTTMLLFIESDGTGVDPNTYTWTDQHVQDYIAGTNTGLAWWTQQAATYTGCWVAFFVRWVEPTDPRCQDWREMVLHPSGDVAGLASDVMANFGYASGSHFTRVNSFNTANRATYGTDWAYTAFVAYNPAPAPDQLTDGTSAFAYLYGPYSFLLYRSYGWAVDQVFTHESGHIFGACDEYASSGCSCASICSNGVVNGNCDACSGLGCMMKANTFNVCSYTDDHLGWQIVPCAPAPLSPPSVSSLSTTSAYQGQTGIMVTVTGTDFLYGAFGSFGSGITVTSTNVVNSTTIDFTIDIDNTATPGLRSVTVTNRDLQANTLSASFEILKSTRHYVASTGADIFPYLTPADAATSFSAGFNAAEDGDTVLTLSGPLAISSLSVTQGIYISGAWDGSFTARDPMGTPTTVTLSGNIVFGNGVNVAGIDGFQLSGGHGSLDVVPDPGDYGGAIKANASTIIVRNCELAASSGTSGIGFSGGGALFARDSDVTLDNVNVNNCTATYGGGIYLYNSTGSISDCVIESNTVAQTTVQPRAAGVMLRACGTVTITNSTIHNNTGAQDGGGMHIDTSGPVTVTGGTISHNTATLNSGGAHIIASTVTFDGTVFSHNSGVIAGAVGTSSAADVDLNEAQLLWNSALIGGGVYASTGSLDVLHSLIVGNAGTSAGGGLNVASLAGGSIAGNTLDRNTSGGVGGMILSNSPIEVYDNIVANTTGDGISCSGTFPTLSYNILWNSSGSDYVGCTAGTGSGSWDPVFVDTANGDYHLGVHSGAIDAGRPGGSYEDPDGSPGDIGIYGSHAFTMDQPAFVQNLAASVSAGDVILTWDASPEGDVLQYAVYCDTISGFKPGSSNFITFVAAPDTSVNLGAAGDTTYYVVNAIDTTGYAGGYSNEAFVDALTGATGALAHANRLFQNVPNPFNPTTSIRFEVARASYVSLVVYDVTGRVVATLADERMPAGLHVRTWNGVNDHGASVATGVYFYKLRAGGYTTTRKMVLLK